MPQSQQSENNSQSSATPSPAQPPATPPISPQQFPAAMVGINFPNPTLSPESIRATNEFLIHDSNNRLKLLDNQDERKTGLIRWYIVAGVILLIVFCGVAGWLAYLGHEKFAKTLLTYVFTFIAGGFGGWGIGRSNK